MFDIETLLAKTDLRDLVQKAGGQLNKDRCACPIHGGDNSDAFHIFRDNGKDQWKCFTGDCGGGDAITFVMKWRGWDFKRACEFLGGDVQSDPAEMKRLADERLDRAKAELADKQARHDAAMRELRAAELHLHYHKTRKQWARDMWAKRGLDEGWQDFFTLGACDDFVINGDHHTPTLTIPILDEQRELQNIKHRLVNPQKPKDKYRPERSGLGAFPPMMAFPELGMNGGIVVVVEGEIKAMVTWATLNNPDIQVIGVPGRTQYKSLEAELIGKNVVVIPDPGAEKEAFTFAQNVKGKYIQLPDKIDDFLIATCATSDSVYALLKQARKA
jgi:hypothetical protein